MGRLLYRHATASEYKDHPFLKLHTCCHGKSLQTRSFPYTRQCPLQYQKTEAQELYISYSTCFHSCCLIGTLFLMLKSNESKLFSKEVLKYQWFSINFVIQSALK